MLLRKIYTDFFLNEKLHISFFLLFIILCSTVVGSCSRAKQKVYFFEEQVAKADIIVIGRVRNIDKKILAKDIALVRPIHIIKGQIDDEIQIKFGDPAFRFRYKDMTKFVIEHSYLLFLIKDEQYYKLLGKSQGYYPVQKDGSISYGRETIILEDFVKRVEEVQSVNRSTRQPQ